MESISKRLSNLSREMDREILKIGTDRLIHNMHRCFYPDLKCHGLLIRIMLRRIVYSYNELDFDTFENWVNNMTEKEETESEDNFKTLCTRSRDFMLVSFFIYGPAPFSEDDHEDEDDDEDEDNTVSLRSGDNVISWVKREAATTYSILLQNLANDFPDDCAFDVPGIPSLVLPNITSFLNKKHKNDGLLLGTAKHFKFAEELFKVAEDLFKSAKKHLISIVDKRKAWVTRFVKTNQPLLSYLHQAADYLNIPSLLELTSEAMGNMKQNSAEEISEWYEGLSISRLLSPLGIQLR